MLVTECHAMEEIIVQVLLTNFFILLVLDNSLNIMTNNLPFQPPPIFSDWTWAHYHILTILDFHPDY